MVLLHKTQNLSMHCPPFFCIFNAYYSQCFSVSLHLYCVHKKEVPRSFTPHDFRFLPLLSVLFSQGESAILRALFVFKWTLKFDCILRKVKMPIILAVWMHVYMCDILRHTCI